MNPIVSIWLQFALCAGLIGIVIVSLAYRPVSRVAHIGNWASLALLALYLLNAAIQFFFIQ